MADSETKENIQAWWVHFASKNKIPRNAVYFVSDYQRSYPFGKLLGQVLHTVQNNKDEITKQASPTGGLELQLNSYLTGKLGKRVLKRSPRHSFETGTMIEPPENGADIYLTINHVLQTIARGDRERSHQMQGKMRLGSDDGPQNWGDTPDGAVSFFQSKPLCKIL